MNKATTLNQSVIVYYDQSFEGFLSAIYDLYADWGYGKAESRQIHFEILPNNKGQHHLLAQTVFVATSPERAEKVLQRCESLVGKEGIRQMLMVFLSERPERESLLLSLMTYLVNEYRASQRTSASNTSVNKHSTRQSNASSRSFIVKHADKNQTHLNPFQNFAHPDVMRMSKIVKSVGREVHSMYAFVRFEKLHNGIYFAKVEPEFNVLPLISDFFRKRFADQAWLIYDVGRSYGLAYDLKAVHWVDKLNLQAVQHTVTYLSEDERYYQDWWRTFFKHINIVERKNKRKQMQSLPRRYWKYLTEQAIVETQEKRELMEDVN